MKRKIFAEKKTITHEDIETAMSNFFAEGGSISVVKAQTYIPKSVVGGGQESLYEGMEDVNVSELNEMTLPL